MKALGIVRKIDELGRIVIPKEIRKRKGWEEGCPMEFFLDGERLIIQSYNGERDRDKAIKTLEKLLTVTPDSAEDILSVLNYVKGDQ